MPSGRKAHVGLAKETTFGTAVGATNYHRFRGGEALRTAIEEVIPPNILGVPWRGPTYQGERDHTGPIPFDVHPNIFGYYLLSALGVPSTVQDEVGVRWTHTFAPRVVEFADACWLQPLTWEIHRDLGQAFQYAGGVVNQLQLTQGVDEKVLSAVATGISKTMARITATSPTFEATQAFRWNQVAVTLPDPTAFNTMRRVGMMINNEQEGIHYLDQSLDATHIRGGDNSSSVTVEGVMRGNSAEYTEFINGTERFLKLVWTGPVLGTNFFMLTLEFPKFRYSAKELGVAGPGEIFIGFRGEAKYDPATANTPMRAILRNSHAAY